MKVELPRDTRFPLVKVIVGIPDGEPLVMVMDDSHRSVEIPDEANYADAYVCDGHARSTMPPTVLVARKPEPEPEPEPEFTLTILPELYSDKEIQAEG